MLFLKEGMQVLIIAGSSIARQGTPRDARGFRLIVTPQVPPRTVGSIYSFTMTGGDSGETSRSSHLTENGWINLSGAPELGPEAGDAIV